MNKIHFTKQALEACAPPANLRKYVYDSKVHGLALAVTPLGRKTFILYRKIQGRPERITIGRFPDLSIEQARGKAHELNAAIALGENPALQRRAVRGRVTLGELFEEYLERHLKVHTKRWKDAENIFRRSLSPWRSRPANDIRQGEVAALHRKIGKEHGQHTANRAVELLSALFNKATKWGYEGSNPARGVTPYQEKSRERFLRADELPAFFRALAQDHDSDARDFFMLCLLTGVRSGNVKALRWEEVDLPQALWRLPDTKSGSPQTVVLIPVVVALLEERQKTAADNPWVFPAKRGRSGHMVNPKPAWKRILKAAGLADLKIHDLRRTFGSWQAATGASLPIIGKSLGHKSLSATQVYARLDLEPVRAAVGKATTALLEAGSMLYEGRKRPLDRK